MKLTFKIINKVGTIFDDGNAIKTVEGATVAKMQEEMEKLYAEHISTLVAENPQLGIEIAINKGEKFINNFFSTSKLLQMKMWWDTFPRESTPKLNATYQWIESITSAAISGSTDFSEPPHTFLDIAQESIVSRQ